MAIDIATFTDLDAVAADAGAALDRAQQPLLFNRLDWFRLILSHCPPPGTPLIVRARDEGGTAWLFLLRDGSKATALANWYSLETGMVCDGHVTAGLVSSLAVFLRTVDRLSVIDLAPLHHDGLTALTKPFRAGGWLARHAIATTNWSIAVSGSNWADFLQARPARLRNTIRRKGQRDDLDIEIYSSFQENKWDIYEHIYDDSWKPAEGSSQMLRALARQEGEAGTLRLGLAFYHGKAVAAQFWLVENGQATIHKLAHTETSKAKSPGTLLTAAMFRHAIEQDHVRRIDFGTGDDPYKADWMDHSRPLYHLRLYNSGTFTGVGAWGRDSLSAARRAIRRES
jgi:hypothetical protein